VLWQRGPLVVQPVAIDGRRVSMLEGSRYTDQVSGLPRVQRLDDVLVPVAKPRFTRDSKGLHLKITPLPRTRVRGTATITADTAPIVSKRNCLPRPNSETHRYWQHVSYRNGANALTIRMDIGRDISAGNAVTATLSRTTVN
jgi:hypothetical protein